MYTKNQLAEQFNEMGLSPNASLLVHSSMKSIGEVEGGAETVLDVLCEGLNSGLLVMPTHTWDTIIEENSTYDFRTEPSCTGILGTLLLKRPGAIRSLHPTHSVAAYGKDAEKFVEGEHLCQSPCPREGVMGKLLDRHGKVLFIGCPLSKNTFIHGVEEWAGVSHRLSEPILRNIVMRDGRVFFTAVARHSAPIPDVSLNYAKLEQPFLELGIAKEFRFGDARCVLCDCDGMTLLVSEMLILQPDLFLDDKPVEKSLLEAVAH